MIQPPTLEDIETNISEFNMETVDSDKLATAYKLAKTLQERYKANSKEVKALETFKKKILTRIGKVRKTKSIEEQDAEMMELIEELNKRK